MNDGLNGKVAESLKKFDLIKWNLCFEITKRCNMACALCGADSGPNAPFEFLQSKHSTDAIHAASSMPIFNKTYVASGGEATLAYNYDKSYLRKMFAAGLGSKMRCTLRTNGTISKSENLQAFCDDMEMFLPFGKRIKDKIRIGLSLDKHHGASVKNNAALVNALVRDMNLPLNIFFIVAVGGDEVYGVLNEFSNLIEEVPVLKDDGKIKKIGKIDVIVQPFIANAGRAIKNNLGSKSQDDLLSILPKDENDVSRDLWLSVDGSASLMRDFKKFLSVPGITKGDDSRDLYKIMKNLRRECEAVLIKDLSK